MANDRHRGSVVPNDRHRASIDAGFKLCSIMDRVWREGMPSTHHQKHFGNILVGGYNIIYMVLEFSRRDAAEWWEGG